jgi:hypothetical protein
MDSDRDWLPEWWRWELELTPHLFKRMEDRNFTDIDVRLMLDDATDYRPSATEGRFVIRTKFERRFWEIVVEPNYQDLLLLVIAAYVRELR